MIIATFIIEYVHSFPIHNHGKCLNLTQINLIFKKMFRQVQKPAQDPTEMVKTEPRCGDQPPASPCSHHPSQPVSLSISSYSYIRAYSLETQSQTPSDTVPLIQQFHLKDSHLVQW